MRITQGNMLTSLENVTTFLSENADEIGETVTPETEKELGDCITELGEHIAVQNGRTRIAASTLARQKANREALIPPGQPLVIEVLAEHTFFGTRQSLPSNWLTVTLPASP